jgi:hypothetical protein
MSKENEPAASSGQLLIYNDGASNLQVRVDGNTVWLTQRLMAELYGVTVQTINEHIQGIYADEELTTEATIRSFRIVQTEGNRSVTRNVEHYSLDLIIAVGYRVRSTIGTRFRQWATAQLRDLLIKGFVLDDERIKSGKTVGQDYFDELLARIRDIRASEQLFYKKIIDIYATSIDYDSKAEITQTFFQTVQNKLHFAVHGQTAAEIVNSRADSSKPTMGLTSWKNAPGGPIRKADVSIAKNYLTQEEITELNRIVTMYLDYAEDQARNKKPMHMGDWIGKLNVFLRFNEREVLKNSGKVSHALAKDHAHEEFAKFEARRLATVASQPSEFDNLLEESKRVQKSLPPPKVDQNEKRKKKGGK